MVSARQLISYAPYANQLASMVYNKSSSTQRFGRSNSRTMTTTKRKKKQLASSIKRVISNEKPAKHRSFYTAANMSHNLIYSMSPTEIVTQGDTNEDRDGDQIELCALKLKGSFFCPTTANGYSYRIIVGYSGEEYPVNGVLSVSGLIEPEIFLPATGAGHRTNAIINPKAFTCLHDETIDVNSLLAGVSDVYSYFVDVPLNNHKFLYQATQSIYGKTRNLYVVVISTATGGTLGVTASGACQMSADLIFK